jgi:cytochrome d ubiquinol oxidase subunit I
VFSPRTSPANVAAGLTGYGALLAGWVVTETGRQPFTVFGVLRTVQGVSPVGTPGVMLSLGAFAVIYFIVLGAAMLFLLRLFARTPSLGDAGPPHLPQHAAGITPGPFGIAELPVERVQ